jgi:iron complex transport system substrate-binding protein
VQATLENILHIGKIVNREDGAKKVVDDMKSTLEEVQKAVEGVEKVSVYYVVGFGEGGDYTATGDTFIHDMLTLAGGDNVAGDTEGWSYNLETLLQKDPQVVIVATEWDTKSLFLAEEGYQELSAVKNQQVYEIDTDLLQIQGPRVAQGVLEIAKILHPDKFTP